MAMKKIRIAHILNPVNVGPESDLHIAQPVTFQSMRNAREVAHAQCDVEFLSAQYPEDRRAVPPDFTPTPDLERSIMDFGAFQKPKKLPVLKDILDRLYEASDAEYFIYTNVDIALMPNFYNMVCAMTASGLDAFVINRRTISTRFTTVDALPFMFAEAGIPHGGYDCFIFRREHYPHYDLGRICIGAMAVGSGLLLNMACFANRFYEARDLHLTFHLGDSRTWRDPAVDDIQAFNENEFGQLARRLTPKFDPDRLPQVGQNWLNEIFQKIREFHAGKSES